MSRKLLRTGAALAFSLFAFAAPVSHGQTAPPMDGLGLWLDAGAGIAAADGEAVLNWEDQSPNANHALALDPAAAPTFAADVINGHPAVHFDGTDDYLDVFATESISTAGDFESFYVARFEDFDGYRAVWAKTDVNWPAPTDYYLSPNTGIPVLSQGDGETGINSIPGERAPRAGQFVVMGFGQSGTTATHYINAQPNGSGEVAVVPFDEFWNMKIGTRDDLFTKMKGEIAEILIYNRALTGEEREQLVTYLRTKYGLLNELPTITITAPETVETPGIVTVTAEAADTDGTVARVEFLVNGAVMATATQPPYTFTFQIETPGTLTLAARAIDDRDERTTSSELQVTVTGEAAPELTASPNLRLWLRGDAGVTTDDQGYVTEWRDQSGNENHATQADPFYAPTVGEVNGQPALRFDPDFDASEADFLDVAESDTLNITGDIASFFVIQADDFATYRAVWGQTAGNVPRPNDYYLAVNSGVPTFYRGTGEAPGQNAVVTGAGGVTAGVPLMLGVQQAGAAVTHFLNGRPFGTGEITLTPEDNSTGLRVGSREDMFTKMRGQIAELLIYDAALSEEELAEVRRYLGAKYGISVLFPINEAPSVQITAPSPGAMLPVPSTVELTAEASDPDGTPASVSFYANGSLIGTAASEPFTISYELTSAGTYEFTAVAMDNFGATASSGPVAVSAGEIQQLPIPAANLQFWVRSDEGLQTEAGYVTGWLDQSGNENHVQVEDPFFAPFVFDDSINGLPTVQFDGFDDQLIVPHSPSLAITGDISSFFVVRFIDFATYRAVWAKTEVNQPRPTDYYLLPNSGLPRLFRGGPDGNASADAAAAPAAGEFVVLGFVHSGTDITHYMNGEVNGSGLIDVPEADAGTPMIIGSRGDGVTRMFGDIAEIVIYNRALDAQERAQLHQYFGEKYGLPTGPVIGPEVSIALTEGTVTLSWPAAGGEVEVQAASQVLGPWEPVTEPVVPDGEMNTVTVTADDDARFFRLERLN